MSDSEPVFTLNVETFTKEWVKHKPFLDYDPDQFPNRFKYDVQMVIHCMKVEFAKELQIYRQKCSGEPDTVSTEQESRPMEPSEGS